jgi:SAM-dependent methyltransferase
MNELIERLPPGARVLDLGAGAGSFQTDRNDLVIVRLDLEPRRERAPGHWVAADAALLPFAPAVFDLVISNHSLEHFPRLEPALRESGRTVKPGGALYIAVPDASTLADRIYRWLGRGGGHVNPFYSAGDVIRLVEHLTGLEHRATRVLFTSFSFLNSRNFTARPPRRIILFANGDERFLALFNWCLRAVDRRFGTRWSHYGWSFYFGDVDVPEKLESWVNVCVRCGAGHSGDYLRMTGAVGAAPGIFERYLCPDCGAPNRLTRTQAR